MQRNFLYFYIFVLAFLGCEINGLEDVWQDATALMVFLSVSFLIISSVEIYNSPEKENLPGKSEIFLFLFLIWSASTFYFSVNPDLTSFPAMKCLGALAFGLGLFLYLENKNQLTQVWLVSFVFAGILGTSGVIERFFPLFIIEQLASVSSSKSLFVNPNFYSCYLLLHIPVGIYLYFRTSSAFTKNLIGIGWIFSLVALGLSDSQAAQLITGMQIIATILYFQAHKEPERAKLVGLAALVAFLIFFNLVHLIPGANAFSPEIGVAAPKIEGAWLFSHVGVRLRFWLGAWRIFCEHWLIGGGLWTYSNLYPFTGLLEVYEEGITSRVPPHAHNLYLQTAAESGLIGLALLAGCLIFLFKDSLKIVIQKKRETRDFSFFLLCSVSGFLIHNISESNWLNSLFIYYFVLLVVSMGLLYRESTAQVYNGSLFLKKSFTLPSIFFVALLIGFALSNYYKYNQIIFKNLPFSQTPSDIEYELRRAKNLCKQCGSPYYLSGFAKIEEYKKIKNPELLNEAQKEFSEALFRNPYNPEINMFQGDIYNLQRRKEDAKRSYKAAMKHPWYTLSALERIKTLEKKRSSVEP